MSGILSRAIILVAILAASAMDASATPRQGHEGRRAQYCDIVVKRSGGNPTQDMTGSIGHAKSYQSNGGPARQKVCVGPDASPEPSSPSAWARW